MQYKRETLVLSALSIWLATLAAAQNSVSVEVAKVESGRLDQTVTLPGELLPFQAVDLRAKVMGFVESIPVDRGSRVGKGDRIALLSAPELEARRAEAQAELAAAEAELAEAEARLFASSSTFERLSEAAKTPGVVAGNDLIQAEKTAEAERARVAAVKRTAEAARAALASFEEMTAYLRVTAPFDGIVTERRVHVGSLVGPESSARSIIRLEQLHPLRLVTAVPETYAVAVTKGAEVRFSVSAYPGEMFSAKVARPSLSVSQATRTMAVEADVDNREERLAPGMYAEVSWPIRRGGESLFVPRTAVAETTERVFVIRVQEGRADWVDVRRGAVQGDRIEIFGELTPGEHVVLRATDEIRPGTRVEPK